MMNIGTQNINQTSQNSMVSNPQELPQNL